MIVLVPITPGNELTFRATRLRALQDTPGAFGSTYAKEAALTDADWTARTLRWSGQQGAGFLAMDQETACGIVGTFLDQDDPAVACLVSMWTAPTHRHRGVGRLLVNGVIDWSRLREARTLQLMVTSNNEPAIAFYQRMGFIRTGRTAPYVNDPSILEYEMSRPLS